MATPLRALATIALAVGAGLSVGAAASCGGRTPLPFDVLLVDGSLPDTTEVGPPDRGAPDVPTEDVVADTAPVDMGAPDVPVYPVCAGAGSPPIYLIGKSNILYSYDPMSSAFVNIGLIACPGTVTSNPFSIAIDRTGAAYVEFRNGELYAVSTATADCKRTRYDGATYGRFLFGMAFVANRVGSATDETLYLAANDGSSDGELFDLDTSSFVRQTIGPFAPTVQEAQLSGTGDGRLFAFQPYLPKSPDMTSGAYLFEVDRRSAKVLTTSHLLAGSADLQSGGGYAFALWGGEFYIFTAPGTSSTSVVNKFDPVAKTLYPLTTGPVNDTIIAAGASTCAPHPP